MGNVDRHNNNADTEFIVQHQQQDRHQHYNIDNHIREKYDQVFWEDTRLLFKIMESIKTQLREVQNKYGAFQRLQRTFVQAIQRSYAQAYNHNGNVYHITNISHIENLLKDFTEHKTDRRVISQFLSIIDNLNQIRQALWDLNSDCEEVRRVLRS